jgi:imidazolonepropionase
MLPEEIFNAATLNAAHAMEVNDSHGVIRVGAPADFFLTEKIPSLAFIPYAYGQSPVWKVWVKGHLI